MTQRLRILVVGDVSCITRHGSDVTRVAPGAALIGLGFDVVIAAPALVDDLRHAEWWATVVMPRVKDVAGFHLTKPYKSIEVAP